MKKNFNIVIDNHTYLINNEEYHIVIDTTDDICEALLINENNNDVFLSRCGDTMPEAIKELEIAIADLGLSDENNNVIVFWKDLTPKEQKKIKSKIKTLKSEAISEWDSMQGHFLRWKHLVSNLVFSLKDREVDINTIYPSLLTYNEYLKL